MRAATMKSPSAVPARNRMAASLLLVLMTLGSFALWIGIPTGSTWLASQATDSIREHSTLAILITLAGMLLFAILLSSLNTLYLRVTGVISRRPEDPPWRVRGPLESILAWSFVIALVALCVWFFLFI